MIRGKVLQGLSGCDRYKAHENEQGCYVSAYDPATRQAACGDSTPSRAQGTPGGDTWGKIPNMLRAGGETWITGSYDPELNLTYWGVAQAKPWMQVSRGAAVNDQDLYTSSTLALRPDDGSLAWYFQHVAERNARPRRSVRARAGGYRRSESGVHHRQSRHSVEARSPGRKIHRRQGNAFSERVQRIRSENRQADLSPGHRRAEASANGCRPAPAPRAATTGRP